MSASKLVDAVGTPRLAVCSPGGPFDIAKDTFDLYNNRKLLADDEPAQVKCRNDIE